MTNIRVDPDSLEGASDEINDLASQLEALAREISEVAASAPSYDGQFGPKVSSLAAEGESRLGSLSDQAEALGAMLQAKSEGFRAVDLQSQSAFARLQFSIQDWLEEARGLKPLAQFVSLIGLENLVASGDEEERDAEPPWWAPGLVWLADGWNRAVLGAQGLTGIADVTLDRAGEGFKNLVNLIAITQYQRARAEAIPAEYLRDYIFRVQQPGLPSDGPITPALLNMSRVDSNGEPVSIVGSEVAASFANRRVDVSFVGRGGSAPVVGRITIDDRYHEAPKMETPFATGLVAHELTHLLERDIGDPKTFPGGHPRLSRPHRWVVFDSTNYMEVLSYIVGETVEYDLLMEKKALGTLTFEDGQAVSRIEDDLATYTAQDAENATRYVVKDHPGALVYEQNFVVESREPDHRIPDGGWDYWLQEMGLSEDAIDHIRSIASQGTAEHVPENSIDPNTGEYSPSTPTPTSTSTSAPTSTSTPKPTSTQTPTESPQSDP